MLLIVIAILISVLCMNYPRECFPFAMGAMAGMCIAHIYVRYR